MIKQDYEIKTAFTLADVCDPISGSNYYGIKTPALVSVCDFYNIDLGSERPEFAGGVGLDLWRNVFIRYYDQYVIIQDGDNIDQAAVKKWIRSFMNIYLRTKDKYNVLLAEYQTAKNNLMARLKTSNTSTAKFNDTPQSVGEYSSDPFVSNITQGDSETLTDVMTPIQRLKEIQDNYTNLLALWSNDFNGIFIEEGNL